MPGGSPAFRLGRTMDLDAFVSQHAAEWRRLDELAGRRRLTVDEADELITLYRRAATHLSLVQSRTPDPATSARLSGLLARARAAAVGGTKRRGWAAFAHGVTVDFPVAVYRAWRWWVAVAAASIGVAGAMMLYLRDHPERLSRVLPSGQVRQLVDHDFAGYYSAHPAQSFALQVWTNNAVVTALSLFLGVTVIGTLYVMWQNVVNVGIVGGALLGAGKAGLFFGLILPHGMLELTAVFVSGGVGLRTGWSWISPGALPRSQALAEAGRMTAVVALGLVGVLFVSGAIEAFVTPSGLPTFARIGIGAIAEVAFLTYIFVLGRRGVRAGATGDLAFEERESLAPVA
jgi:uncharacterized membrane protein SpoIIM required for sporulation